MPRARPKILKVSIALLVGVAAGVFPASSLAQNLRASARSVLLGKALNGGREPLVRLTFALPPGAGPGEKEQVLKALQEAGVAVASVQGFSTGPGKRSTLITTLEFPYSSAVRLSDHLRTAKASLTVNVNIGPETNPGPRERAEKALFLTNFLRNIWNPEHQRQIRDPLGGSPLESFGAGAGISPHFLRKILDPQYRPTLNELYYDLIYRHALERLGYTDAWTLDQDVGRIRLLGQPGARILASLSGISRQVLGPLLLSLPSDPLNPMVRESHPGLGSGVETFAYAPGAAILDAIKETVGLADSTRRFGAYEHDALIHALTGLDQSMLQALRDQRRARAQSGDPVVLRYVLGDSDERRSAEEAASGEQGYFSEVAKFHDNVVFGMLRSDKIEEDPLVIEAPSVAYHAWTFHGNNFRAQYNPGLVNQHLIEVMTIDKEFEGRFWEEFAPGAMPRTLGLREVLAAHDVDPKDVRSVKAALDSEFPNGWVLKHLDETNTGTSLLSDRKDLAELLARYGAGDFDEYRNTIEAKYQGEMSDKVVWHLKKHPDFMGWRLHESLRSPERAIVQERLDIAHEFRIEVVGGSPVEGAMVDRHYYEPTDTGQPRTPAPPEVRAMALEFARTILSKLEPRLRATPFALDIAITASGKPVLIESNPGPGSGFIIDDPTCAAAFNRFLTDYPRMVRDHTILSEGFSPAEQLVFLRKRFTAWGIDPNLRYPGLEFQENGIRSRIRPIRTDPIEVSIVGPRVTRVDCAREALSRIERGAP